MNQFKFLLITFISAACSICLLGQQLVPEFAGVSRKKISYLSMEDGTQIKGNISGFKWKKGLIEEIKIKGMDGKKIKIKPEKIKHMYLPISATGKLANSIDFLNDATQWGNTDLDKDILQKGYYYFEKSDVKIKRKTRTLMMQLLNPSFSEKVKIYNDPFAKEALGLGVGSIKLVGGGEKSYFIKKGNDVAYKLEKKNYDEEFPLLFKDCSTFSAEQEDKKWSQFTQHVFDYTKTCN